MNNKVEEILLAEANRCESVLSDAENQLDAVVDADVKRFHTEVYDNIPKQFGEYLDEALGDKINSVRKSKLNMDYFNKSDRGQQIVEEAKKSGISIEDYMKQKTKEKNRHYWSNSSSEAFYVTVGNSFGVSYLTARTQRIHTMYFDKTRYFYYLKKGHVDQISNRRKRECAGAFLEYRDDALAKVDALKKTLIEVNIPYKKQTILEASFHNRYDRYNRGGTEYSILGDVEDSIVNHIYVNAPTLEIWDGVQPLDTTCKYGDGGQSNFMSFVFLTVVPDPNNSRNVKTDFVCNLDIDTDGVYHSLKNVNGRNSLTQICGGNDYYGGNIQPLREKYGYMRVNDPNGIPLDMAEIVKNPIVKAEIDERLKVYSDVSKGLMELKEEFADLYFVNSASI